MNKIHYAKKWIRRALGSRPTHNGGTDDQRYVTIRMGVEFVSTSRHSTSVSLLQRLQTSGEESDWRRFIRLYSPLVLRWGANRGFNREDASDLVQEVMCKMITHLKTFDFKPDSSFRSWLRTVVHNQATDMQRRRAARPTEPLFVANGAVTEDPLDVFESQEYCRYLVGRALVLVKREFAESTWHACWMSVVEGEPTRTVAEKLNLTENAVRVAKHRVLARLRVELRGLMDNV